MPVGDDGAAVGRPVGGVLGAVLAVDAVVLAGVEVVVGAEVDAGASEQTGGVGVGRAGPHIGGHRRRRRRGVRVQRATTGQEEREIEEGAVALGEGLVVGIGCD